MLQAALEAHDGRIEVEHLREVRGDLTISHRYNIHIIVHYI